MRVEEINEEQTMTKRRGVGGGGCGWSRKRRSDGGGGGERGEKKLDKDTPMQMSVAAR